MPKMLYLLFVIVMIPAVLAGCTKSEPKENEQQMFKRIEQSLKEKGVPLSFVSKQESPTILEGVVPNVYKVDLDQKVGFNDRIEIYRFDSNEQLQKGLKNQSYTVTLLSSHKNYIKENVLLVYFAANGKTDKYNDQINEVIESL